MKRFFAFLFVILSVSISSCSIDDDGPDFYHLTLPVDSVVMPDSMQVNQVYEVTMTYTRPDSCYIYSDIFYSYDDETTRTVAIICSVYDNSYGCEPLEYPEYEVSFDFHPTQVGTYTFRFWQGQDENGVDQFLILEIPVTS